MPDPLKKPLEHPVILALRPPDAAQAIGVSERTLWQMTKAGQVPHVRLGERIVVYPVAELKSWLAHRAEGGAS